MARVCARASGVKGMEESGGEGKQTRERRWNGDKDGVIEERERDRGRQHDGWRREREEEEDWKEG